MTKTSVESTGGFREIPHLSDDLEAIVADIECYLLSTLTPEQFSAVEILVEASRLLTEANLVLGAKTTANADVPTPCAWSALESRAG